MCHKNGVIHRDLNLENFLHSNKKINSPLHAIDFGLCVLFTTSLLKNKLYLAKYS
uniref:Predicted protein n=1 Tax=Hordeum vulgare subsp. vulgare TaxID=112509 RepID=F2D633_HORVV|nr:predicted protein [Hordeum vulgare subsp. vulgare]